MLADQRLEDGGMFRVHGQDADVLFGSPSGHQLSGHHKGLFVGQRDLFPMVDGVVDRAQARHTHDAGEHHVHTLHRAHVTQRLLATENLDVLVSQCFFDNFVGGFLHHHHDVGLVSSRLLYQQVGAGMGGNHLQLQTVRVLRNHLQRLHTH